MQDGLPLYKHFITGAREDRPIRSFVVTETKRWKYEAQKFKHPAYLWPCTFNDNHNFEKGALYFMGVIFEESICNKNKINLKCILGIRNLNSSSVVWTLFQGKVPALGPEKELRYSQKWTYSEVCSSLTFPSPIPSKFPFSEAKY